MFRWRHPSCWLSRLDSVCLIGGYLRSVWVATSTVRLSPLDRSHACWLFSKQTVASSIYPVIIDPTCVRAERRLTLSPASLFKLSSSDPFARGIAHWPETAFASIMTGDHPQHRNHAPLPGRLLLPHRPPAARGRSLPLEDRQQSPSCRTSRSCCHPNQPSKVVSRSTRPIGHKHVLPKYIFSEFKDAQADYRKNLITVRFCDAHNKAELPR